MCMMNDLAYWEKNRGLAKKIVCKFTMQLSWGHLMLTCHCIFYSRNGALLIYKPIFVHNMYLWWLPAKRFVLAWSDHSTQSQSMCQQHLANPRRFNLFLWNSRGFLMASLPNSFLAWRFWQIVFFKLARPSESTHYFNCVLCFLPTKLTTFYTVIMHF